MALGYFEITDEELSSVAVPRGEPLPPTAVRAVPRPLHGRRADPDEHARAGRRRGALRGRGAGREVGAAWPATRGARSRRAGTASTCSASTATTTTTRCGRRAWSSASRRWCTARCSSTASRGRSRTTCTTTSTAWRRRTSRCASRCSSSGVTHRFPELRIGFLEGGVAWACALFSSLVGHWEKRNRDAIVELDPDRLDVDELLTYFAEYGDDEVTARHRRAARLLRPAGGASRAGRRVRGRRHRRPSTTCATRFEPNFYFGCEADDPLVAWAFRDDVNPLGARLRPVLGSDISHWDVRDMTEPVAEAYELVEHGRDHRARLPRPHVREPGAAARRRRTRGSSRARCARRAATQALAEAGEVWL